MDIATIFALVLSLAMVVVIVRDAVHYVIPNTLNLAILGLYTFAAYLLHLDWPMALVAAAIVLVIGFGIFSLGLMGGGDIKLLVVLSLWTGWGMPTIMFIMYTAILGGLLVILVLLMRFLLPPLWKGRNLPRLLIAKQAVPYGIAIAASFLLMLWFGAVPGLVPVL
jgi:prepilin peptidase CpaA